MTNQTKKIISRYISIKQDGQEIYCEDIPKIDNLDLHIPDCLERLFLLRKVMPKSNWKITIETEWKTRERRWYEVFNTETRKFEQ